MKGIFDTYVVSFWQKVGFFELVTHVRIRNSMVSLVSVGNFDCLNFQLHNFDDIITQHITDSSRSKAARNEIYEAGATSG